jgi:hypothetical protein
MRKCVTCVTCVTVCRSEVWLMGGHSLAPSVMIFLVTPILWPAISKLPPIHGRNYSLVEHYKPIKTVLNRCCNDIMSNICPMD